MKPCTIFTLLATLYLCACNKSQRPNDTVNTPKELLSFLDKPELLQNAPRLGELMTTDYNVTDAALQTLPVTERNAYTWASPLYGTNNDSDWINPYRIVNHANQALEILNKMDAEEVDKKPLRGNALFLRSFAYYNILAYFAKPYDPATAATDWGIVKKITSNPTEKTTRISNKESYDLILADLQQAAALLPPLERGNYYTRPNKPAAYALLARIYLSMRDYNKAALYADTSIRLYSTLLDYSRIITYMYSFSVINEEVLYRLTLFAEPFKNLRSKHHAYSIDTALYNLYDKNDLRRIMYFDTTNNMYHLNETDYSANHNGCFGGLATDEMYLIRAECYAREGNKESALLYLNKLLAARYETGTFQSLKANTAEDALKLVLLERRKELCFRGLRFYDLRRLNKEGANIELTRAINGKPFTLPSNSTQYVLPLPPAVVDDGIPQNPE